MNKVLEGIRVLDVSRWAAGPWCGKLLADMGAEVIRIERPGGEEDRNVGPFAPNGESIGVVAAVNANKKGVTLSLRSERGQDIFKKLVRRSDVVLENFAFGAKEVMGVDYESLRLVNPAIILVSVSGFGEYGPCCERVAFDSIAQAASGAMSLTGFPDGPPTRSAVTYVDLGTATSAALGALLALYHREKTGTGQKVEVSLFDTAVSWVACTGAAAEYKLLGDIRQRIGNWVHFSLAGTFKAKDGWVTISLLDGLWRRLARLIGKQELLDDPRFKDDLSRYRNRDLIDPVISEWVAERTAEELVTLLEEGRVPCAKVNTIADMANDPHVQAREMLVDVDHPGIGKIPLPGVNIKLSVTPGTVEKHSPLVGEHNEEIYCGLLGYSLPDLAQLRAEGVI